MNDGVSITRDTFTSKALWRWIKLKHLALSIRH